MNKERWRMGWNDDGTLYLFRHGVVLCFSRITESKFFYELSLGGRYVGKLDKGRNRIVNADDFKGGLHYRET